MRRGPVLAAEDSLIVTQLDHHPLRGEHDAPAIQIGGVGGWSGKHPDIESEKGREKPNDQKKAGSRSKKLLGHLVWPVHHQYIISYY